MRNGQHEVLGKRVHHAERDVVLVVFAEDRDLREILQHVVHPPHVPLHGETQAHSGKPGAKHP